MSGPASGKQPPTNALPQRNPCDCNCVLFNNNQPADRRFTFKLEDGERLQSDPELYSPERASTSTDTMKKKISVAALSKQRESKKSSRLNLGSTHQRDGKALIEMLEQPTDSDRVSPANQHHYNTQKAMFHRPIHQEVSQPVHTQRLNQTYEVQRPIMVLNAVPRYNDESSRGFSHKPSLFQKSVTSTSYPYRTTENHTIKSASRQELMSSFMGRQLQTNSFVQEPRLLISQHSLAQSTNNQRISEYSPYNPYRVGVQQATTRVPETVPEELTSRSNTVEVVIPPIPLRQLEEKREREAQALQQYVEQQHRHQHQIRQSNSVNYLPHYSTDRAPNPQSSNRHTVTRVSMRQSVGGNFLREAESILNFSPPGLGVEHQQQQFEHPQPQQPMRFKKIESVGDDLQAERDDDCSEVLGHYSPAFQMPLRKLVRRSQAPTTEKLSAQPPLPQQVPLSQYQSHSLSSRSRYDRSLTSMARGTAVTDRHASHTEDLS